MCGPQFVDQKRNALSSVPQSSVVHITVTLHGLSLAARYKPGCLAMCRCGPPVLLCITLAIHRRLGLYLQVFCSKVSPNCGACPLQASCEYALNNGKRLQPQAMKPSSSQRQVGCTFTTDYNALNSTDSSALFTTVCNALFSTDFNALFSTDFQRTHQAMTYLTCFISPNGTKLCLHRQRGILLGFL